MLAIGVMSGTSADGVDVAAIEIGDERPRPRITLLQRAHHPYDARLASDVLAAGAGAPLNTAAIARLHARLGDAYANAVDELIAKLPGRPDVIAVHGQTVAHLPGEHATLQLGDASRIALRTGVPTVSDFRSADVAAGGEGAPLTPFADHVLFADRAPYAVLNLGGIANVTLLPTQQADDVIAFDCGPGNMVLDALARTGGAAFDRDGERARRGRVVDVALDRALAHAFFERRAPKSTGREDFGETFARGLAADVRDAGGSADDALATAVALTARSISDALKRETPAGVTWRALAVGGGGALNRTLLDAIRAAVAPVAVVPMDDLGIPAMAREAVAFAILGAYRMREEPNTLPRCTGASRAVCAGAVHRP